MNEDPGDVSRASPTPPAARPPQLMPDQLARLAGYGVPQEVRIRDVVFRPGDPAYDLILVEAGQIEIVSPAGPGEPETVLGSYRQGGFLGELSLLTGQSADLTGRVVEAGRIRRISRDRFRELMTDDPELSDILLRTFIARRELLRAGQGVPDIEIVGSARSAEAMTLRTYAARQRLPHLWLEADSIAGRALMRSAALNAADLPAIVTPDQVVRHATPRRLARTLGLPRLPAAGDPMDLTIIGAGPAGLAAAVWSSSEGLKTLLLDAVGVGGQAAASSLIENQLGFPAGISGLDLAQRVARQALKFGARLSIPGQAAALDTAGEQLRVVLADGTGIDTRAVLIATGARYRVLPLARWAEFEGAGIYYAATEVEARACAGEPVTVIGGANSAGTAALYLAARGSPVTVAVRGPGLSADMSAFLAGRLYAHAHVTIRTSTEITRLDGTATLEAITLTDTASRRSLIQPCRGLFSFIGADPATAWNHGLILDADGFVRTGADLAVDSLDPTWTALGRATAAAAGLLILSLTGATSSAQAASRSAHVKPTIVLVHGAWADGSSWAAVTERLQGKGFTVDVEPNPLRGVASDAQYLKDYLAGISGPIVLVAHSYGGMVTTNAATGNPNVKELVYIDAYVPAQGDSVLSLTTAQPGSVLAVADPATVFDTVAVRDAAGNVINNDLYVKPALFPGYFAAGVPAPKAALLAAGQRPLQASALGEAFSGVPAWKTIPSWDLIGTADRVIPPAEQQVMAARAGAHVVKVNAPHLSMVSDPGAVTALILLAAAHS